jgi:alkyldihydroxyacetonephosphate synthase
MQLARLAGRVDTFPLAVVWPADTAQVSAVISACAAAKVAIVPFGAGSGVCGATLPTAGSVVVDLKRLKTIRRVDADAGVVEVEAGIIGERFERLLERRGLTLGHFPSSILCSTVGGWIAGRSAGQCSSRYGKIEDMVVDLEVVTGDGIIRRTPHAGASPDWNQLFIGSEGTLGIITAATLRVHPQPIARAFHGWHLPTVEAGVEVMRRCMQAGLKPAALRMYDALDTKMVGSDPDAKTGGHLGRLKALATGSSPFGQWILRRVVSASRLTNAMIRTMKGPVLLVSVCEGVSADAIATDAALAEIAAAAGGVDLGEGPGRNWLAHRHDVSYKQSKMYAAGCFVDTFEVATTWSRVGPLYEAVRRVVAGHVMVMAHFSHAYPGGCSIYFTFVGTGRGPEGMAARYDATWHAALSATQSMGAAIAHHHGSGLQRRPFMDAEHGAGRQWFEALKSTLDPHGVLNPGKLFGEAE